jgi:hypothetical protein
MEFLGPFDAESDIVGLLLRLVAANATNDPVV